MAIGNSESEKWPAEWDFKQSFDEWYFGAKAQTRSQKTVLELFWVKRI